jgi:hypothetical protein
LPIFDGATDFQQHLAKSPNKIRSGFLIGDPGDMDLHEALADRFVSGLCRLDPVIGLEHALAITFDRNDRMGDKSDFDAAVLQLTHDRINQKRHVVIDDLDERHFPLTVVLGGQIDIADRDRRTAWLSSGKSLSRGYREIGDFFGAVELEIVDIGPCKKIAREGGKIFAFRPVRENPSSRFDQASALGFVSKSH